MAKDLPALRVIWGDDDPHARPRPPSELSAEMTLVEFFWRYAWPDCLEPKGDSIRTRKDYVTSLDYWALFTGDPPIYNITKRTCSQFLRRLAALPGQKPDTTLAANTIRKHWINIQRLLEWTGPHSRQTPQGTGLVDNPPWLQAPPKDYPGPKPGFSLDEIWDWLRKLPEIEPRRLPKMAQFDPVTWWRALILTFYNTGMRPGMLLRIRWEMIYGHVLRPPVSATKGRRGQILWLNNAVLDAIEPLKRPKGLVFGWEDWSKGETTLRRERVRQERAAGIRCHPLKAFRRTFDTECTKINPVACQIQMNHMSPSIQMAFDHYLDAEEVLGSALEDLPQPGPLRQQLLPGFK